MSNGVISNQWHDEGQQLDGEGVVILGSSLGRAATIEVDDEMNLGFEFHFSFGFHLVVKDMVAVSLVGSGSDDDVGGGGE